MKKITICLCTVLIGMTPLSAWPETSDDLGLALLYGDEESVSIATGSSKPIHLAPSVASVITAEDIKATGATTLDEALEMVPGLHVSQSFNRLNALYSIRGIHTGQNPQVLLLMDGVSITHLITGGRPNTLRLPVEDISRIEVIRGPGSALYGADAFAGVINVITKTADDLNGSHFGVRTGSFASHSAWAQYGGNVKGWDVALSVDWQKSDGDDGRLASADLQTTLDDLFGGSASYAAGPLDTRYSIVDTHLNVSNDHWTFRFWNWRQFGGGLGAGSAQALDSQGDTELDAYLFDAVYQNGGLVPNWEFQTRFNLYYQDEQSYFNVLPPGTVVPIGSDGNLNFLSPIRLVSFPDGLIGAPGGTENTANIDLSATYSGIDRHRFRYGLGVKYQTEDTRESKNFGPGVIDGTQPVVGGSLTDVSESPYVYLEDRDRTIWYALLQDEWLLAPDWEITAGLRFDHYSDFGSTLNPRVALVWSARYNLTAKLLYGRAFRSPSFSELYFINNPALLGNPELDPETIDTVEVVLDYRPNLNLSTTFNLFTYRISDLIDFVQDPTGTSVLAENAHEQEGYGFEFEANWQVTSMFRVKMNYAWQNSEDSRSGDTIPDAPGQQFYLGAYWDILPDWSASTQLNWVGDRKRAAGDGRDAVDDYTLVDLTLRSKAIAENLEFAVSVRNLFDEDAYEPSNGTIVNDYMLPGRNIYAELRLSI